MFGRMSYYALYSMNAYILAYDFLGYALVLTAINAGPEEGVIMAIYVSYKILNDGQKSNWR